MPHAPMHSSGYAYRPRWIAPRPWQGSGSWGPPYDINVVEVPVVLTDAGVPSYAGPSLAYAPAAHAIVDDQGQVAYDPAAMFFDDTVGLIAVGVDGVPVILGWGFSDLGNLASSVVHSVEHVASDAGKAVGQAAAKAAGTVSNIATQVASAPLKISTEALSRAVGAISPAAGDFLKQGLNMISVDRITQAEKMLGGAFRDIGDGKNVGASLASALNVAASELREVGPYAQMVVSFVPGIGTGVSMALGAGIAIANGKRIDDILLDAAEGAMPGGPAAKAAFKMGRNLIHGENVLEAGIEAARAQLPVEVQAAFDTAIALSKGKKLQDALAAGVRRVLPAEGQAAFDAASAIVQGKNPTDAIKTAVGKYLPKEAMLALDAAQQIASGKNVLDVAASVASSNLPLPAEAKKALAAAIQVAHGQNLAEVGKSFGMSLLPPDAQKAAQAALAIMQGKSVLDTVQHLVASKIPPEAAAALAAAEALRTGKDPIKVAQDLASVMGGQLPPAAARMLSTVTTLARGGSPIEAAKSAAMGLLPANMQGPAGLALAAAQGKPLGEVVQQLAAQNLPPGVVSALAAAEAIRQGRSPELAAAQLATALGGSLPPEAQRVLSTAKALAAGGDPIETAKAAALGLISPEQRGVVKIALGVLDGKAPSEALILLNKLPLPPEVKAMAQTALLAAQGRNPQAVGLAVMRRTLGPAAVHAYDAAVGAGKSRVPGAKQMLEAGETFAQIEAQAEAALRAAGLDPKKMTPAGVLADVERITLPAEVAMQMPAVKAAYRVSMAAKQGSLPARTFIAQAQARVKLGDLEAARIVENLHLAEQLQKDGQIRLKRGMKLAEVKALIDLAKKTSIPAQAPRPRAA